jgi:hypothetical protein
MTVLSLRPESKTIILSVEYIISSKIYVLYFGFGVMGNQTFPNLIV